MVGWTIANNKPRVAKEAGEDPVRIQSLELPETRSEAALPMQSRGKVIGALTVQSEALDAFNDEFMLALQTMVDQVAVAIDNAMLWEESRAALEVARAAFGDMTKDAWAKLPESRRDLEFSCDESGVRLSAEGNPQFDPKDLDKSVNLPIKIRGQILGTIQALKPQQEGEWTPDEIVILQSLTDQLSMALDNARLYSDSQRQGTRERMLSDITAKVRASTYLDTILQTAIQELAQAMHVPVGSIQLRSGNGGGMDEKS